MRALQFVTLGLRLVPSLELIVEVLVRKLLLISMLVGLASQV